MNWFQNCRINLGILFVEPCDVTSREVWSRGVLISLSNPVGSADSRLHCLRLDVELQRNGVRYHIEPCTGSPFPEEAYLHES